MNIKLECFFWVWQSQGDAWFKACFSVASAFFWGVPHINGIESSHHFKLSYKGWAMRRQLGIHILQYPVSPRKVAIVFESWGQALEDSLFFAEGQPTGPMCNLNSEVSELCALAWQILYPLSTKKFRTWIACCWAFFSSGEQIYKSCTYCNILPLGPRLRSKRSQLIACPNSWGLSLNLWSNSVQGACWCFLL